MKIISDLGCWSHGKDEVIPGCIENPGRFERLIEELIKNRTAFGKSNRVPNHVRRLMEETHTYIDQLITAKNEKKVIILPDGETYIDPYTYDASLRAAQCCIEAAEHTRATGKKSFALVRPPGHHAHKDFTHGFCSGVNNMVIATQYLLKKGERVFILDIDAHRGCGTQDLLAGVEGTHYFSINIAGQWPDNAFCSRPESDNIENIDLSPEGNKWDLITDDEYIQILRDRLIPALQKFKPSIVGISAGFDTYRGHNFRFNLTERSYKEVRDLLKEQPWFAVLEGGYSPESILAGINSLS